MKTTFVWRNERGFVSSGLYDPEDVLPPDGAVSLTYLFFVYEKAMEFKANLPAPPQACA